MTTMPLSQAAEVLNARLRGADVTGIDFSKRSIDHARETAAAEGLSIRYINENYLELELNDRFDLITMIMCDFCALSPQQRQTLMFSATFSKEIRALAADFLVDPQSVQVTPPNSTAERVDQWIYPVDKKRKPALLINLVQANSWDQVLIFTRTKHGANRLSKQLDSCEMTLYEPYTSAK